MARTMTDGREELIREVVAESVLRAESGGTLYAAPLVAELDAERAAHEATKAAWKAACEQIHAEQGINTALKARLALAEDVCDLCAGNVESAYPEIDYKLREWRAAK